MKQSLVLILLIFNALLFSQNFTQPITFINYIEGEWEKIDTPNLVDQNSTKFLRFKFERITGDSLHLNVSAKSNTGQVLKNLSFNCQEKQVNINQDTTDSYAFLYLNAVNQNLMFRFDSISDSLITLKVKMNFWTSYSTTYYLKRVSAADTLYTDFTCDSQAILPSYTPFGCNDSIIWSKRYGQIYLHEQSTTDTAKVGVFIQNYPRLNSCDSLVVLTVSLLDSSSLYLSEFLRGKWKWSHTSSGWGTSFADSLNYPIIWNVHQHDSLSLFPYTLYVGDTLYSCASFYLLSGIRLENSYWSYPLLDGWRYTVYVIDTDKVALMELFVDDGPTHFFNKISQSTIDYQSYPTCNINEVGIDTIYGSYCDTNIFRIVGMIYDCPTSIIYNDEVIIDLYPNPSSQVVFFGIENPIARVEVYDVQGQVQIVNYLANSNELAISHLNSGLYFLKLFSDTTTYYVKLMKN